MDSCISDVSSCGKSIPSCHEEGVPGSTAIAEPGATPADRKTAPLIDGFLHPFGHPRISVDRLTIVGDLKKPFSFLNRWQANTDIEEVKVCPFPYRHLWKSVANYVVQQRDQDANIPELRIEFNPNTLCYSQSFFQILCNLDAPRLTRIDYAADYPFDISHFKFETKVPKKKRAFYSRSGCLETYYIGNRSSGSEYRIYDKQKESKLSFPYWRIEHEKHFSPDEKWHDFLPFEDLTCYQVDYAKISNLSDRAMLYFLNDHPEVWGELHHKKKKRLKDMIHGDSAMVSLDPHPLDLFRESQTKLFKLIAAFLNPSLAFQPEPVPF